MAAPNTFTHFLNASNARGRVPGDHNAFGTQAKSLSVGMSSDSWRARDSSSCFTSATLPTLNTLDSLPNASGDEFLGRLDDQVFVDKTFNDSHWRCDLDSAGQGPQGDKNEAAEAPATSSWNESALTYSGGYTHPGGFNEMAWLTNGTQGTLLEDRQYAMPDLAYNNNQTLSEVDRQGFDPRAVFPRGEYANDESNIALYEGGAPSVVSRPPLTTIMVCNLPCKMSTQGLSQLVEELGFGGLYDDTHVPHGKKNFKGYGFVNFVSPSVAARFVAVMNTYIFPSTGRQAQCRPAASQGLRPLFL